MTKRCECGAEARSTNEDCVGCSECEESALHAWAAERTPPDLPTSWWRKFEPYWGCGLGYYFFGRKDLTGKAADPPHGHGRPHNEHGIVRACEEGVSIEEPDLDWRVARSWQEEKAEIQFSLEHVSGADLDDLLQILHLARAEHVAIKTLHESGEFERRVRAVAKRRRVPS